MEQNTRRIKIIIVFILILSATAIIFFNFRHRKADEIASDTQAILPEKIEPKLERSEITVEAGDVFSKVAARAGLDTTFSTLLYETALSAYDLAKIKVGNKFFFYKDELGQWVKAVYAVDNDRELIIEQGSDNNNWQAQLIIIDYEIKDKTVEGSIESSLYQSLLDQGIDEGVIIEFAESLEWSIDFANDPRVGDKYKFIFEERFRDGQYVMPGRVLAGGYLNEDKLFETFYFEETPENKGYFDDKGNSVQKIFLKAPLSFKYISSPFTTGRRYIEAFNVSTNHRAVDYAATAGTPIRAVGDGTVTFAGWNGGYGRMVSIRHNATYSTNYAHQSKMAVKSGQKVKQGQVIGYVGSTGFSTGPHLHYEMVKNGVKVNPNREVLPPGKPIGEVRMADFKTLVEQMREKIKIE